MLSNNTLRQKYILERGIRYCDDITKIENYQSAVESDEIYEIHHRLEEEGYSKSQLIKMNRYFHVSPDELIFLPRSLHKEIHGRIRTRNRYVL